MWEIQVYSCLIESWNTEILKVRERNACYLHVEVAVLNLLEMYIQVDAYLSHSVSSKISLFWLRNN
jgi:hypothetical protein